MKRSRKFIGQSNLSLLSKHAIVFILIEITILVVKGFTHAVFQQQQQQQQQLHLLRYSGDKFNRYRECSMRRLQRNTDVNDSIQVGNHQTNSTLESWTEKNMPFSITRNEFLQHMAVVGGSVLTGSAMYPTDALAAKAEIDPTTGNLFSPKADMLSGGSDLTRGIPIVRNREQLRPGQALQSIYETRFVAYLSRFLLNFDPSARAYWVQQGFGDSWDIPADASRSGTDTGTNRAAENAFAEFAESVEVGLADYFSGPFGSYSSLPAMVAGINAAQPAQSRKSELNEKRFTFLDSIFSMREQKQNFSPKKSDNIASAKQGILNLYTLLKARYNSLAAKRQLAILFSFVTNPDLQPVNEIRSLLGEIDNSTITAVQLSNRCIVPNEVDSRTSSRRGGGYAYGELPSISVESPPPLGDKYRRANITAIMEPTSRVLRIKLSDAGAGYVSAPTVTVIQHNGLIARQCQATAILDRLGRVESIFLLDSGFGYGGGRKMFPPKVIIEPPLRNASSKEATRPAKAYAQLEYKIAGIQLIDGGTGFVSTEPPKIKISPPLEDPDWYIDVQDKPTMRMVPLLNDDIVEATVTEMKYADGNIAYSISGRQSRSVVINDDLLTRISRDPLELLPSSVRPDLIQDSISGIKLYSIPKLAAVPQSVVALSPRYRADDPIFGGVGRIPVTKGANALTVSEYARLALSGAVCTVAVRTALNPLELIKTKQQLQNDEELFRYAESRLRKPQTFDLPVSIETNHSDVFNARASTPSIALSAATITAPSHQMTEVETDVKTATVKIGTIEMMRYISELRGPLALFQSADITFLASLVFGSFGFGATELFRRSFTNFFFSENVSNSASGSELVLLLAASIATVLTALAASPFEVLRVRSMGLVIPKTWTEVLEDFLEEKNTDINTSKSYRKQFNIKKLQYKDVVPLWSGFGPILSRELPFAIAKFLTFDLLATTTLAFLNSQNPEGSLPIQIGVGPLGLTVSAIAGAFAGIAGAIVSHPADLILTKTSATRKNAGAESTSDIHIDAPSNSPTWVVVIQDLLKQKGGISNLFVGLGSRSIFFFLVIGLQFFLYDYVKSLFQVSTDDLSLILDVFYAVRAGLVGMDST